MIKVFIQSVYPAPYRVGVFNEINKDEDIELDVAFENSNGDNRNKEWFEKNIKFNSIIIKQSNKEYKNKIKNIRKYDIVLAYDYSSITSMILMLKCIIFKIPYIINCDGAIIRQNYIKDMIKRFFIKRATACFANGKSARDYFLKYGARKENIYFHKFTSLYQNEILREPLTIEQKEEKRKQLGLNNKKIFLSVGSFIYRKGYDLLIEAVKEANCKDEFIIIGGGELLQEYKNIIKENNLDNIKLIDFMSKNQLLEYYDASDIFIFPTREDIWGLVINEAMSRGLPVITTDNCIAGVELIENEKNGEIVKTDSREQLARVIDKYSKMGNKELFKYGEQSIKIIKDYTIENIAKEHLKVLKKICKEKN